MQFQELITRAKQIREKYRSQEELLRGKSWGKEQIMEGFMGDVGDLTKLVMAKEGWRGAENLDEKLAHELADCLWSIIILSDKYDVNLEDAFNKNMVQLEKEIETRLQENK